jgi:hypothetical protein
MGDEVDDKAEHRVDRADASWRGNLQLPGATVVPMAEWGMWGKKVDCFGHRVSSLDAFAPLPNAESSFSTHFFPAGPPLPAEPTLLPVERRPTRGRDVLDCLQALGDERVDVDEEGINAGSLALDARAEGVGVLLELLLGGLAALGKHAAGVVDLGAGLLQVKRG